MLGESQEIYRTLWLRLKQGVEMSADQRATIIFQLGGNHITTLATTS